MGLRVTPPPPPQSNFLPALADSCPLSLVLPSIVLTWVGSHPPVCRYLSWASFCSRPAFPQSTIHPCVPSNPPTSRVWM